MYWRWNSRLHAISHCTVAPCGVSAFASTVWHRIAWHQPQQILRRSRSDPRVPGSLPCPWELQAFFNGSLLQLQARSCHCQKGAVQVLRYYVQYAAPETGTEVVLDREAIDFTGDVDGRCDWATSSCCAGLVAAGSAAVLPSSLPRQALRAGRN
jgi:hypothetical protein